MSQVSKPDPNVHEIIIVKRRGGGHDDGHHGGVWKIAFADFMTAMMAFFLVLWIVNSTSKETRSSIARYFNPIKLAETTPARKGLRDPKESDFDAAADDQGKGKPSGGAKGPESPEAKADRKEDKPGGAEAGDKTESKAEAKPKADAKGKPEPGKTDAKSAPSKADGKAKGEAGAERPTDAAGPTRLRPEGGAGASRGSSSGEGRDSPAARAPVHDEGAIAADPQAVLADLLAGDPLLGRPQGQSSMAAPRGFRDPFEASSPRLTTQPRSGGLAQADAAGRGRADAAFGGAEGDGPRADAMQGAGAAPQEANAAQQASPEPRVGEARPAPGKTPAEQTPGGRAAGEKAAGDKAAGEKAAADRSAAARSAAAGAAAGAQPARSPGESAAQARAEIIAAMAELFGPGKGPSLEVSATQEGLLINLTDSDAFEMFAIGSSEPHPRAIALLDRLAKTLARTPGPLVVRGHTDARPWRKGVSDNWRLSGARAHMAFQMLLRGGLDGARLERLEGLADRRLRKPSDPFAAENRRIELLVRAGT